MAHTHFAVKGACFSVSTSTPLKELFTKAKADDRIVRTAYEVKEHYIKKSPKNKTEKAYTLNLEIAKGLKDREYAKLASAYKLQFTAEELKLNAELDKIGIVDGNTTIYFCEAADRFLSLFLNIGDYESSATTIIGNKDDGPAKAYYMDEFSAAASVKTALAVQAGRLPKYPIVAMDIKKLGKNVICKATVIPIDKILKMMTEVPNAMGEMFAELFGTGTDDDDKKELLN